MSDSRSDNSNSFQHLQAELARIDLLVQRQVRLWQLAGQNPADPFRGSRIADSDAQQLAKLPLGTSWGATVALPAEEQLAFDRALDEAQSQADAFARDARDLDTLLCLDHMAQVFSLDRFDMDVFLLCLAPALDLRYERLYSYLQDDVTRKRPRVNLVLDLLCGPGPERLLMLSRFASDAPLFRYHLLERSSGSDPEPPPLLSQVLSVDQAIVAWLLGEYQPHEDLGSQASLEWPAEGESEPYLVEGSRESLESAWAGRATQGTHGALPILALYGPDETSQRTAARWLAARAGRSLLSVDLAAVFQAGVPHLRAVRLVLRDARLVGAVPYLRNWDAAFPEERSVAPQPGLLAELCAYPDLAIVAGQKPWQSQGIDRARQIFWIEFPIPGYAQRLQLWSHLVGTIATVQPEDVTALASQFQLSTGQIRDAVASARDRAAQQGEQLNGLQLLAAARAHSNPYLSGLARKIVPRYNWHDIVLPGEQLTILREIVSTVRSRPLVLEQWGVGKKLVSSAGVTILFAGPPGTGKTMAAEVITAELGLDLYKIDLSTIISKYIGETEKNLERIFNEAQSSNAILFFDEADAIFGKRSEVKDAHDRYANIEVSYLLQRMEAYDGVTILATNLRANLDVAFTRRLQFAVDFPFPEEEDRLRIWHTLFPPDVPRAEEIDFDLLARRFKLAGGSIRNIIVSAAYLAAADGELVTMDLLLHGTRRELQKMGRLVN